MNKLANCTAVDMNGLLENSNLSWIAKNLHNLFTNRQMFIHLPSYGTG